MAFLAAVAFVQDLAEKRRLLKFSEKRREFEEFLVKHKYFLNQIVRRYGSLQRSVPPIQKLYTVLFEGLRDSKSEGEIISQLQDSATNRLPVKLVDAGDREHGRDFSTKTANAVYLESVLQSAPRCGICEARLHMKSATVDHKIRKEDGGTGAPANGQLTHPYCNSGYKEHLHSVKLKS